MADCDHLVLKWGTLKGWDFSSDAAKAAFAKLANLGPRSVSAAMQRDTDEEKEALLELIDAVHGIIVNDWTGDEMTKEGAKKYVREYQT